MSQSVRLLSEAESAAAAEVSVETIRKYRDCGLLDPVLKDNQTYFQEVDIQTLFFTKFNRKTSDEASSSSGSKTADSVAGNTGTASSRAEGHLQAILSPSVTAAQSTSENSQPKPVVAGPSVHGSDSTQPAASRASVASAPSDVAPTSSQSIAAELGSAPSGSAQSGSAQPGSVQAGAAQSSRPSVQAVEPSPARPAQAVSQASKASNGSANPEPTKPVQAVSGQSQATVSQATLSHATVPQASGAQTKVSEQSTAARAQSEPQQAAAAQPGSPQSARTESICPEVVGAASASKLGESKSTAADSEASPISPNELIELNKSLRDQIQMMREERDWLRDRIEKLESRSEREQMLLLSESENVRKLITATQKSFWQRALPWLGDSKK